MSKTTLWIDSETRDKIMSLRKPGESANDVLERLLPSENAYTTLDVLKRQMAEDAETKAREIYLQRLKEYRERHADSVDKAIKDLGLDEDKKSEYWLKSKIEKDK